MPKKVVHHWFKGTSIIKERKRSATLLKIALTQLLGLLAVWSVIMRASFEQVDECLHVA
jgi:hypothetical protein